MQIQPYTTQIRLLLTNYFNLEELKTLSFDLQIDYEEIAGDTKSSKIRELVVLLQRQDRLHKLVEIASKNRPNVIWPDPGLKTVSCPYQGLAAFQETHSQYFFGRNAFTSQLFEAIHKQKFTAIVGPSGSGKSSIVFAGLVPQLRHKGNWLISSLRPGRRPFAALAAALITFVSQNLSDVDQLVETPKLARALQDGTLSLTDVFSRIEQANQDAQNFLLIIDQFEELYTFGSETNTLRNFLDTITSAANLMPDRESGLKPTILITLRADFLGRALLYRPLADILQDHDLKLGPMNRDELTDIIIQPAAKCGVTFDSGLVSRILDDLGATSFSVSRDLSSESSFGRLPLLEFALTLLWEWQSNRKLTHTGYEAIGKVDGALASYADEIYEQLGIPERERVKRIMVQMVHPGAGTEDTRRIATREDLAELDWPLVLTLANARLVITDQGEHGQQTVEIIHEALIQHWGRLQEWMASDRTFRMWQEGLRKDIHQWRASNQDKDALLRGIPLAEAEGWLAKRLNDLSQGEQSYIQESIQLREQEKEEQEEQRIRELLTARRLAETERQRAEEQLKAASKLRRFTYYITIALGLAILTAVVAVFFGLESEKQKETAITALETTEAVALARVNDSQVYQNIAIQARETARAISPPTPLPNLASGGSGSMMSGELNILIAEFSVTDESLAEMSEQIHLAFFNQYSRIIEGTPLLIQAFTKVG